MNAVEEMKDESSSMDELLAFMHVQLDQEEQAARKAASLCGCHPDAPSWIFGDEATDGRVLVADDPHPQAKRKLSRPWSSTYDGLFMAEHIVRHDPARVLREVEAKRRILDEMVPIVSDLDEIAFGEGQAAKHPLRPGAHLSADGEPVLYLLRLLALPYADHPDYQESWKP